MYVYTDGARRRAARRLRQHHLLVPEDHEGLRPRRRAGRRARLPQPRTVLLRGVLSPGRPADTICLSRPRDGLSPHCAAVRLSGGRRRHPATRGRPRDDRTAAIRTPRRNARCHASGSDSCRHSSSPRSPGPATNLPTGPGPRRPQNPSDRYRALLKEYQSAMEDFTKVYRDARTDEARSRDLRPPFPSPPGLRGAVSSTWPRRIPRIPRRSTP